MTLEEAIRDCPCDVLREKLRRFCVDLADTFLHGFACPVCSTDIRSSFNPSLHNPTRGNCIVCKLGLTLRHRIEHEGHINQDGTLCAYEVNLPAARCSRFICELLKARWEKMNLPRRELTREELHSWLTEVQSATRSLITIH